MLSKGICPHLASCEMKVVWLLFHEHVIARCRWHVTLYVLNVDCPHLASCEMKVVW